MLEIKPNTKQQECIDNIDGKYLVLAGPGTGKTFTITQRIKHMVELGKKPERILCLTFSETAASQMRNKLTEAFNGIECGVNIYTYHGFCNDIIGENAEEFELRDNYKVISQPISRQFLKECIDESNPVEYRNSKNDPYVYLNIISNKISEIKRYRLSKQQYFKNIETNPAWLPEKYALMEQLEEEKAKSPQKIKNIEKIQSKIEKIDSDIAKAKEIWDFYELYKSKMESESYIDFNDMIGFVLDKFESSPTFLDKISQKYDYILVDEYQDTNDNQNQIVFNLVESNENVFVVGDDDQIIFSFQGANLDTIEGFLNRFPDTNVICLEENMRSTQSILDVARIVSKQDDRRLEINPKFTHFGINKDLKAMNKDVTVLDKKVRCTRYQNQEQEFTEIVSEIEKLVNSDQCPVDKEGNKKYNEIAILATGHEDLAIFADMLKDKNIQFERKDGRSIFEIKSSITLFYYLQMLVNPEIYSDKILKLLLLPPFQIHPIDYAKIYKRISNDKTFIESMKQIDEWQDEEKINKFIELYDSLQSYITAESVRNVVMEVGAKTGIFDYFLNEETNRSDNIAGLKKLVDEAKDFSNAHNKITIQDFVEYLLMIQNDKDMDITTDKPDVSLNAIQLTTYHSAKGKEYEYVYMPTLQSKRWESSSKSFKPTIPVEASKYKTDDEWKLYRLSDRVKTMYVGMTRAKHTLRLSYVAQSGKMATTPSAWILAAKDLMEMVNYEELNAETVIYEARKALTKRTYNYKRDFTEQVNKRIDGRNYSPTAFNAYQSCPRKFFYGDILKFDGRVGFMDAANYGSAFHAACEFMAKEAMKKGEYPSKEEFYNEFKTTLDTLPLSSLQQREIFEGRGIDEIDNYYHHLIDTPAKNLFAVEYKLETEHDGVKFKGIVDKITKNDDGTYSIIDYKTSSPVKASAICPNGIHEDYYNQICLYKYYFEKITGATVRDLSFIFTVDCSVATLMPTEEECEEVITKLKQTIKDISDCEFEPSYKTEACKYCAYKDFCGMEIV